eukprot:scaffold1090_cov244-Chaetoceros_neogracile.AAC.11
MKLHASTIIPFNTFTLLQPIKHASTILYTTIIDQLNAILISTSHIAVYGGTAITRNTRTAHTGLAKELKPYKRHEDETYHLTANTGSRRYMAPEIALRKRGFRPKLESLKHWPDGLRAMISRCWDQDMNRRPSFRDVVGALLEIKTAHINED